MQANVIVVLVLVRCCVAPFGTITYFKREYSSVSLRLPAFFFLGLTSEDQIGDRKPVNPLTPGQRTTGSYPRLR